MVAIVSTWTTKVWPSSCIIV